MRMRRPVHLPHSAVDQECLSCSCLVHLELIFLILILILLLALHPQYGPATHIDFCDVYPYHCAVTASTRVSMHDDATLSIPFSFSPTTHTHTQHTHTHTDTEAYVHAFLHTCARTHTTCIHALTGGPSARACTYAPMCSTPCAFPQVVVYNGHTRQVGRTFSRFKDTAYSGCFRSDGRLLVAGGQDGVVQVRAHVAR